MAQVPSGLSAAILAQANRAKYDLAFQISPIILVGGSFSGVQGGMVPISSLYPAPAEIENAIRYLPMEGSTLLSQSVGMYPFANQAIAANAVIQQPLTLSLAMIAPVNEPGAYISKLHLFSGLQATLQKHNAAGGMYHVATPAMVYFNLLLTGMTDVTAPESEQRQIHWQLDFIQPILTQQAAEAQQNALMQKVTAGTPFSGQPSWSGLSSASAANLAGVTGALESFGGSFGSSTGSGSLSGVPTGTSPSGTANA